MTSLPLPGHAAPDVRVIAYYRLPDVPHPVGTVAGEDLPEWIGVRAARSRFAGHEQPQLPGELGYCNVREDAVRDAQAALARAHAISGFCYVLGPPGQTMGIDPTLADIVASGRPDFPFCICWETTRLHAGAGFGAGDEHRERRYGIEECIALIQGLLHVFADRRYLRIGGRPLFIVSSPDSIHDVQAVAARWRDECAHAGVGDPYIACYGGAMGADPAQLGFDATVECPPLGGFSRSMRDEVALIDPNFIGDVRNYRSYVGQMLLSSRPAHTMFRSIMPEWDETVRTDDSAKIFVNANPETFGFWAERTVDITRLRFAGDERLMFVRAWNEWDAGSHLEPDARHGRRYLEALRAAVLRPPQRTPERPSWDAIRARAAEIEALAATRVVRSEPWEPGPADGPRVSVVMPAYNHAHYVAAALDSVLAQSHANLEIIVVNDGSKDSTGAVLDDYAARCRTHALTIVHQPNAGAHEAINHGLALARGEVVALMNSDDLYAPNRLERMLAEMNRCGAGLAISNTRFVDERGNDVAVTDPYVKQLRRAIAEAMRSPDPLYVLIQSNISMSTGNFVFRRELLERTGGFCAMRVCHDWDFLLAASYETPLTFIDEPLYLYRLHGANTFSSSRVQAAFELEQLLTRFFDRIAMHPLLREPARAAHFLEHVRRMGLGGYIGRGAVPAAG
jgi:glycosyltransferase involved in cell wall biosynthesis